MAKDVLITPASGLIQFYDAGGNVDATIQLDDANVLNISGTVSLGDLAADVYIGDGINEVDIVFEQNGAIRALAGKTLTLGQSNSNISFAANITSGANITGNIIAGGNVSGNYLLGNVFFATGITASKIYNGLSEVNVGTANGAANISIGGTSNVAVFSASGLAITGDLSVSGNATLSGNILGDRIQNGTTQIDIQTASGNANVTVAGTSNIAVFASTGVFVTGVNSASGNVTGGNLITSGQLSATGNITGSSIFAVSNGQGTNFKVGDDAWLGDINQADTISIRGAQNAANAYIVFGNASVTKLGRSGSGPLTYSDAFSATGNITGGNIVTAGQITATGNIHGALIKASSNVEIQNRGILYLNDSDNSNYIGLRSPAALTGNYVYVLPSSYGNISQVLTTNGAGGLSWEDQTGGGGGASATQYPNSTVQPVPGATGNFDLSYNFVQTSQEIPFETSATDPFGVNLGEVYSMMDPVGEILEPVDLGVLT